MGIGLFMAAERDGKIDQIIFRLDQVDPRLPLAIDEMSVLIVECKFSVMHEGTIRQQSRFRNGEAIKRLERMNKKT